MGVMDRERWSSRPAFIFAAIGSAVGLGNIWRFPMLAFTYNTGGGAFLIPYMLALILIGIPMLVLELTLGQVYQSGDAIAFGKMHPRLRGIGVASVYCGFLVVVYYCTLLGWAFRCLGYAFQNPMPWAGATNSSSGAWGFVVEDVIGMDSIYLAEDNNLAPTRLVGANFGCLIIVWVLVFLALAFGVKWTGRLTYVTMGLPIVLLITLLVKTASMDGASDGIDAYIGNWNLGALSDKPGQWSAAVSQIFFSLSLTFGIMTAYGSYNKCDANVVQNSVIIGLSNSLFSIVAGFAVFGTLGHLAQVQGRSISELKIGGPGLMFGTYPVALNTGSGGEHWNRLLFIVIILLGIDSAFSLCEAVVTVAKDTKRFASTPRPVLVGAICLLAVVCGLPYTTDAGLILLDTVDYYVNFVMLFVGFFQSFAVGWLYNIDRQVQRVGLRATVGLLVLYNFAVLAGAGTAHHLGGRGGCAVGLLFGFGLALLGMMLACVMMKEREGVGEAQMVWDLFFGNVEELRTEINAVVAVGGQWGVPFVWSVLMKYFIPPVLLILICSAASEETADGKSKFGNYEGYPSGYQFIGVCVVLLTLVIVGAGMAFPSAYASLAPLDEIIDDQKAPQPDVVHVDEIIEEGKTEEKGNLSVSSASC